MLRRSAETWNMHDFDIYTRWTTGRQHFTDTCFFFHFLTDLLNISHISQKIHTIQQIWCFVFSMNKNWFITYFNGTASLQGPHIIVWQNYSYFHVAHLLTIRKYKCVTCIFLSKLMTEDRMEYLWERNRLWQTKNWEKAGDPERDAHCRAIRVSDLRWVAWGHYF